MLNDINIKEYDSYKNAIKIDIDKIDKDTKISDVKSTGVITLKEAIEILDLYMRFKMVYDKLQGTDSKYLQNLGFDTLKFAFSYYYSRKIYLSGLLQHIQRFLWHYAIEELNKDGNTIASEFLEHSLQEKPEDLIITTGHVVEKIKYDDAFKNILKEIISINSKLLNFETGEKEYSLAFKDGDLFAAIHACNIQVKGSKNNSRWDLEITLTDKYDFTEFKNWGEYFSGNFKAIAGNNAAIISTSCNVINEYNIIIKFTLNDWEV